MKNHSSKQSVFSCFIMALSAAFLLAGYEFVRSPSDTLLKAAYGMTGYYIGLALMPVTVLAFLYLYGKLLNRYTAQKTLIITKITSATLIALCYVLIQLKLKIACLLLFLVREAYIVLLIEQIWSFINNTIKVKEARKVNGAILAISTLGGITAGQFIYKSATAIGTENMLVFSVLCFIPSVLLAQFAYNKSPRPSSYYKDKLTQTKANTSNDTLGLSLFKKEPMLFVILFVIIASQIFSTLVSLNYQTSLLETIPNKDMQTAYSANIFKTLNIYSLALQLIIVPIVLTIIPLYLVHFLIPCLNLLAMAYVIYNPSLGACSYAFILFKSLDYSLFRAAKEILYIPLSFEAKFRSKELIDVFGYRMSKSLTAATLGITKIFGVLLSTTMFGILGAIASLSWLAFIVPIARKRTIEPVKSHQVSKA